MNFFLLTSSYRWRAGPRIFVFVAGFKSPPLSRLAQRERNRQKGKRKASTVRCRRSSGMFLLAPISRGRGRSRRENLFDRKRRGTYFGSEAIHETIRQCASALSDLLRRRRGDDDRIAVFPDRRKSV
jgi:hypothetical protein